MHNDRSDNVDVEKLLDFLQRHSDSASCFVGTDDNDEESHTSENGNENFSNTQYMQRVTRMEDGGFHVCTGMACPYKIQSLDNEKNYVCSLTGTLVGYCMESAHDASWTGRSCGSADPDMTSGAVKGRMWKTKRDAFNDSVRAYGRSSTISIDEKPLEEYENGGDSKHDQSSTSQSQETIVKRGAPCICDIDESAVAAQKLSKAHKRAQTLETQDVRTRLKSEACQVVRKLLLTLEGVTAINATKPAIPSDPRLANYDFVLSFGIRKYVAKCKEANDSVQLSVIHDICIASNTFVKTRRKEASKLERAEKVKAIASDGRTAELCSSLIVAIWNAVCVTTHFMKHQSGDSFKPFAAGIMYAFKRGLYLPNGTMLVPHLEDLSEQLPVLRSLVATNAAKQLQASSHKGLCAIHKAISSIDGMDPESKQVVMRRVSVASTIARDLQAHTTIR
tara:strand:+ start:401 stop:1747 length:1347 start_codon:yes stop_codon:yes gene_type:complete